jgi:hypothetical protein
MVSLALAHRPRRLARRLGVPWLPVTLLIRADELCIGQFVCITSIDERGRMAYREAIQHPRAHCETLAT